MNLTIVAFSEQDSQLVLVFDNGDKRALQKQNCKAYLSTAMDKTILFESSNSTKITSQPIDTASYILDYTQITSPVSASNTALFNTLNDYLKTTNTVTGGATSANQLTEIARLDTLILQNTPATTGSETSFTPSLTNQTLLASNANRKQAVIVNNSTFIVYVKYGATATSSSFTYVLSAGDTLINNSYSGRIDAICTGASGQIEVTELT